MFHRVERVRIKALGKAYYEKHREKIKAQTKAWRQKDPERYRALQRGCNGIPKMRGEKKIGTCPLCMREGVQLVPDHDHTKRGDEGFRGWICAACNMLEGQLAKAEKRCPGYLARLSAYYSAHRAKVINSQASDLPRLQNWPEGESTRSSGNCRPQ